jgi:hypothetical protein
MMEEDGEESRSVLAAQRLERQGFDIKLDRGFAEGTYCVYLEFASLAERVGFAPARRLAGEYCALLKAQLGEASGYRVGATEDGSRTGDRRRKRDLEMTFLSFALDSRDGRFHDDAMRSEFRVALLRAGQAWDQHEAKAKDLLRESRQEKFRRQLAGLLDGKGYGHLDPATKERLLADVTSLAFPPRGTER